MTTFEVTIDGADRKTVRVLVEAEHWIAAWQESLSVLGDDPAPTDASCVLDDQIAHIEVPSSGRFFVVKPIGLQEHANHRPIAGQPIVLGEDGAPGVRIEAKRPVARPMTLHPKPRKLRIDEPTLMDAAPPVVSIDNDPVARVLSELEVQRVRARPLRIASDGLPRPLDPNTKRRATPLAVPRSAQPGEQPTRRTRDDTLAFTPGIMSPVDGLPQQFRPVTATGATDPDQPSARISVMQWAVETAWQHVPCALALLIEGLDSDEPEVVFARGEREREVRGCVVPLEHAFRQLAARAPTRTRFADIANVRFESHLQVFDLDVTSALCAPVAFVPGHETDGTLGLGLVLLNSSRDSGFTDSELRALAYLARTLASRLDGL